MDETIEVLKGQRDSLKRKLDAGNRWAVRPAAIVLFLMGFALLAFWFLINRDNKDSQMFLLAGITVISLAILLYFLSPARFLRAEVADAMALSSVTNIEKVLKSMLVESPGVYIPAAQAGATSLLIPVSGKIDPSGMRQAASGIFIQPGTGAGGLMLEPPGYGLLAYVMGIGAAFTDEGLENEVRDALENSLELAGNVTVKRQGDDILVSMRDLANSGMCAAIRKGHPGICMQAGCPVCSFVACAIAEGTGRMVRIERVSVKGRTLNATFKLL